MESVLGSSWKRGSLRRSWELVKAFFHILKRDKEILVFPLISIVIATSILLVLIMSFFYSLTLFIPLLIVTIPLSWIFFTFLDAFLEAAMVGCATIRLQGGDPKVRDGLRIAVKNWHNLLQWALIVIIVKALIGEIVNSITSFTQAFRSPSFHRSHEFVPGFEHVAASSPHQLHESADFAGGELGPGLSWAQGIIIAGIVTEVLLTAWSTIAFFVTPLIVCEKLSPVKAMKRSIEILRNAWREILILKLGYRALSHYLDMLGLLPIVVGVLSGATFIRNPAASIVIPWPGGDIVIPLPPQLRFNIIITNVAAIVWGIAVAIVYWVTLNRIGFTFIGVSKAALYEYMRRSQVEPNAELPQEFNSLNNIIRSLQKGKKEKEEISTEAPRPTLSIADEIKKLAELKEKGMLTEEEFQVMKRKLLEKY